MFIQTLKSILFMAMLFWAYSLQAQSAASFASLNPLLQSSSSFDAAADTASGSDAYSSLTSIMVENRARTLGNQLSGSGTRYFAATDADLRGLNPEQALQRLTPAPITAMDCVRTMEIAIDLKQPLTVAAATGQTVDIGTVDIQANRVRDVEVHASILLDGLTIRNQ